jgi:hypothetical protein
MNDDKTMRLGALFCYPLLILTCLPYHRFDRKADFRVDFATEESSVVSRPSCSCVFAEPYNTCLYLQNCCIVTRAGLVATGGKVLWHILSHYKHMLTL